MIKTARQAGCICGFVFVGLAESAWAGQMSGVPGPIVGAGLPLLALAAGAYVAVKVICARRRN